MSVVLVFILISGLFPLSSAGDNVTTTPITLNGPVQHEPPTVAPLSPITSYTGAPLWFTGDAYDPDSAVLRYTWDLGDGSALKVGQSVSYAYPKPGTWTVTLCVDDLSGLPSHNVSASSWAKIGWRLNLVAGWNLVSLPMVTTCKASTLGLSHGDQVVRWNPGGIEPLYTTHVVGMSLNDFSIDPSNGYWIYTATAKSLILFGTTPTVQQSRYIAVPTGGGWALIGLCSMKTTWKASDLAAMYSGGKIMTVVRWNPYPIVPVYVTHVIGLPLNDFSLVSGEGYWIFVNGSGTLTYDP